MSAWRARKEAKRQRLIAAARRDQLEHLLTHGGTQPHVNSGQPKGLTTPIPHRQGNVGSTLAWCLVTTVAAIAGLLYGGPLFGQDWRLVPLLVAASVVVLAGAETIRHMRRLRAIDQTWTSAIAVLLIAVFLLGAQGQVVVDGKPYWRNSTTAKSYELALTIRNDLYLLQENQSLLFYPPEQARGLMPLLKGAAAQAEQLASRWNPATAPEDIPLPGFLVVYERLNVSADLQRQALLGYAAYLNQPDARLAEEVEKTRALAELSYLQAAGELGAILEPLGIDLSKSGD